MCDVKNCKIKSPFGIWNVQSCQEGLHRLSLVEMTDLDRTIVVEIAGEVKPNPVCQSLLQWMSAYFGNIFKVKTMELPPVCQSVFQDGRFRERVWQEIYQHLHIGETASYGEIARRLGSPGASQAVGTAMKTNPVSLVIPCHRVVKAGGRPGHYHGGTRDLMKVWLLKHEENCRTNNIIVGN